MAVSEWDQRQLCGDDSCIGVIGSEGTCKVCGRAAPNWGDERMRGLIATSQDEDDEVDDEDDEDGDEDGADFDDGADGEGETTESALPGPAAAKAPAWSARALCPDGSCIGVIGADGRCKVCGQSAPAGASLPPVEPAAVAAAAARTDEPGAHGDIPAAAEDGERCADTGCTGLIAADGRCGVCGKGAS